MEQKARFFVDERKCIGCGKCVKVCSGMVLEMEDGVPHMKSFERFGWSGCWRCQHCLAVCPQGAISIFGKRPEQSLPLPDATLGQQIDRLVASRRSCRRYIDKNVERSLMDTILQDMNNVPTGGNAQGLEFTVIDDVDAMYRLWEVTYKGMEANVRRGYFSAGMNRRMYDIMKRSEEELRKDDMLFCGAPHLFVAHQKAVGQWAADAIADCNIASAYFELICNAHGLGTVMMSYAASVIQDVPQARQLLDIPEDHYMGIIVGFGYPEIKYARGVQKDRSAKLHRYTDKL
ncbi:MAG: nitroreductase family protein [Bacteroidaceae bacterium]|nr:nitroreductase family protein [Bacteroidaceae bacterium]